MRELLLDANVLVRFLVQDDPKQGASASALIEKAERREIILHLDPIIIAETVYVLIGPYKRNKADVANVLLAIIQNAGIQTVDTDIVVAALQRFAVFNVDFPDAWLTSRAAALHRPVASFDRNFDKFKDIKRIEPTA